LFLKHADLIKGQVVAIDGVNYRSNLRLYRKRQEINEPIFGTIKRQWGYNHTNQRGLAKVNGEMALIMTVYNIKRAINIIGMEKLLEKLKIWKPNYSKAMFFFIRVILRRFNEPTFLNLLERLKNSLPVSVLHHQIRGHFVVDVRSNISFFTD